MPESKRKLAAIMFTDIVGYSALSQKNEALALELLEEHRALLRPFFPQHGGTEIKTIGDAFLVEFSSAVEAANCAIDIQKTLVAHNATVPEERRIMLRIGIHIGDVVIDGNDVLGDGVNIAARIEPLAEPGGICLSEDVAHQIRNKTEGSLEKLGERKLKNIQEPVTVYRLALPWQTAKLPSKLGQPLTGNLRVLGAGAAIILLAVAAWWQISQSSPGSSSSEIRSIAVLPLENQMNDPELQYFVNGMHDMLISELSKISKLRVRSRTSVMGYAGTTLKAPDIADELNVDLIVEGAILLVDNTVRFTVQLIDARTDEHLMSTHYDREMQNVLALHSEISRAIADSIHLRLEPAEVRRLENWPSIDPVALDHYLRGREALSNYDESNRFTAVSQFEQAIEQDPNYSDAYVGLAAARYALVSFGNVTPTEWMPLAKKNALKGLELHPENSEAYSTLGIIAMEYDYDLEIAGQYFRKSLALNPSFAKGRQWYAQFLVKVNEPERAYQELAIATSLENNSIEMAFHTAILHLLVRDYEQLIQEMQALIIRDPSGIAQFVPLMIFGLTHLGRFEEAVEEYDRLKRQNANYILSNVATALVNVGRSAEVKDMLRDMNTKSESNYIDPFNIAGIYAALDSLDLYFEWMDLAYEGRSPSIAWLVELTPITSAVLKDPRFNELKRKIGLRK